MTDGVAIWWIGKICVCVFVVSNVDAAGGAVLIPVKTKEKDQGAVTKQISRAVATHLSDLLILGG